MSDILVTGATGLLGSVLTRRLVERGETVRIFRRDHSRLDLLCGIERRIEHCVGEITDTVALSDAMCGIEQVYHAAAFVGFGGRRQRSALMRVNVDGTAAVVNAALRSDVRRVVHVSSMAAFGRPDRPDGVIDETMEWQRSKMNSQYAYSKYLSELEIQRGVAEGLDAVIANPALMFGIGRPGENTRLIVDKIRARKLPAIPAGGTNVVDVEDVAEGLVLAMERGETGERYFFGAENISWARIIGLLAEALGVDPPSRTLRPRPALALAYFSEAFGALTRTDPLITLETARTSSRTYRYTNRKAREELGWRGRPFAETAERIGQALRSGTPA